MKSLPGQENDGADPSFDEVNVNLLLALRESRARPFTGKYGVLLDVVGDPHIAEMMWILYGEDAIRTFDDDLDSLNGEAKMWLPWRKKIKRNTIRSLIQSTEGKRAIWRMLHGAVVWLM